MRDVGRPSRRRVQKRPRHPEVNQEHPTAFEPDNQILAATLERLDTLAGELGRHLGRVVGTRQPGIVDLDVLEAAPDEHRLEPASDRLDLGQLGHVSSLVMARRGYADVTDDSSSSRIERCAGCSSPSSYAASTARTASAADASSRACTSARISPAATASPRLRRQTTPTAWSTASSFVRRPAPRWSAAEPTAMAPRCVT